MSLRESAISLLSDWRAPDAAQDSFMADRIDVVVGIGVMAGKQVQDERR